ncbi:esterase/lipase family protein [Saccharothrix xinjiangensis]|uniref:Esterase/lipase family protein n=1 Tax=Saccharothrix xinjiangensis TaxID=204798 RepID=A0ABV9XZW1_9PSEU
MLIPLTALALILAPSTAAAGAARHPVVHSGAAALVHAALNPDTSPAGANDPTCRPTPAHPRPVVLVHGTAENMTYNWYTLSPLLANHGYCAFALNFGQLPGPHVGLPGSRRAGGVAPVARSAAELAAFIDEVLAATGASQVDVVGHSQGGVMPRYYLKFLGGADKVHTLVGLAPPNHGTTISGLAHVPGVPELLAAGVGPAVTDQLTGSDFLLRLNAGDDTVPGVHYTVIVTRYDEVVTPYTSAFLDGPNTTNITLQDLCGPLHTSEHLALPFDAAALRHVLNALDPLHARPVTCGLTLPIIGG